jgi:hypothetical protein
MLEFVSTLPHNLFWLSQTVCAIRIGSEVLASKKLPSILKDLCESWDTIYQCTMMPVVRLEIPRLVVEYEKRQ